MVLEQLLPSTQRQYLLEWTCTGSEQFLGKIHIIFLKEQVQVAVEIWRLESVPHSSIQELTRVVRDVQIC
jgi:hypothetical protein